MRRTIGEEVVATAASHSIVISEATRKIISIVVVSVVVQVVVCLYSLTHLLIYSHLTLFIHINLGGGYRGRGHHDQRSDNRHSYNQQVSTRSIKPLTSFKKFMLTQPEGMRITYSLTTWY